MPTITRDINISSAYELSPTLTREIERLTNVGTTGDESVNARIAAIRSTARTLIERLIENVPPCPDRTAAIREIRSALYFSHAAIISALTP